MEGELQKYVDSCNENADRVPGSINVLLGNERINLKVGPTVYGAVTVDASIVEFKKGEISNPTVRVSTEERYIRAILESNDPAGLAMKLYKADRIKVEPVSTKNKVVMTVANAASNIYTRFAGPKASYSNPNVKKLKDANPAGLSPTAGIVTPNAVATLPKTMEVVEGVTLGEVEDKLTVSTQESDSKLLMFAGAGVSSLTSRSLGYAGAMKLVASEKFTLCPHDECYWSFDNAMPFLISQWAVVYLNYPQSKFGKVDSFYAKDLEFLDKPDFYKQFLPFGYTCLPMGTELHISKYKGIDKPPGMNVGLRCYSDAKYPAPRWTFIDLKGLPVPDEPSEVPEL